jgi:hypothetical protein
MSDANPYEGLNLPDLLERMHDLAMPDSIAWLPQTDGWWTLLAWATAVTLLVILKWRAYRHRNRYRREALIQLQHLVEADEPAAQVAELVKRTALTVYPRSEVAGLYGDSWAAFLVQTSGTDPVVASAAGRLAVASFRPDVTTTEIAPCAERWIRRHHA